MDKVKTYGHILGLASNQYVCFLFCDNHTIFLKKYSKLNTWPWKFKVKVIAKVKFYGHMPNVLLICLFSVS